MIKTLISFLLTVSAISGQPKKEINDIKLPLSTIQNLELVNVKAEVVDHNDKRGIKISKEDREIAGETLVIIPEINFKNGTIEI